MKTEIKRNYSHLARARKQINISLQRVRGWWMARRRAPQRPKWSHGGRRRGNRKTRIKLPMPVSALKVNGALRCVQPKINVVVSNIYLALPIAAAHLRRPKIKPSPRKIGEKRCNWFMAAAAAAADSSRRCENCVHLIQIDKTFPLPQRRTLGLFVSLAFGCFISIFQLISCGPRHEAIVDSISFACWDAQEISKSITPIVWRAHARNSNNIYHFMIECRRFCFRIDSRCICFDRNDGRSELQKIGKWKLTELFLFLCTGRCSFLWWNFWASADRVKLPVHWKSTIFPHAFAPLDPSSATIFSHRIRLNSQRNFLRVDVDVVSK